MSEIAAYHRCSCGAALVANLPGEPWQCLAVANYPTGMSIRVGHARAIDYDAIPAGGPVAPPIEPATAQVHRGADRWSGAVYRVRAGKLVRVDAPAASAAA